MQLDPGTVFAFRTVPPNAFAPPATGRWAAFKIIGADASHIAIAVMAGIWDSEPAPDAANASGVLREHRFASDGRPGAFLVARDNMRTDELLELHPIGRAALSFEERELAASLARRDNGTRYSSLLLANHTAEGEWRWAHDRDAYTAEAELKKAEQRARWAAEEERLRTRLRGLTLDTLLAETPFARWSTPPAEFVAAARAAIHNACRGILMLGPKPRKAEVRKVLRDCVLWFNRADEEAGGVIETGEREDIVAAFEEVAWAAGQKSLAREIDEWREW